MKSTFLDLTNEKERGEEDERVVSQNIDGEGKDLLVINTLDNPVNIQRQM